MPAPLHAPANSPPGRAESGFTLLELMITVAIVGILAGIALPSYTSYIQRSRIISATTGLSDFRTKMEQYFQDRRSYETAPGSGTCGVPNPPFSTTNDAFEVTCTGASPTGYTAVAQGQASKSMGAFRYQILVDMGIAGTGVTRSTEGLPSGWTSPTPNNCFAIRKDGSCT